ncbi:protein FAR1-RELATED SEQUENCE 5-like [Phragmites australis]|uniref:protein FAR1-RELATED SEQUENCE 5-like n=1 Tax=Phragmites australis TaxID=29695 RepID=UPI002D794567|nr:protein FAR1-RELATED SEQUENCE 5-like [Phragmites australis]
MRSETIDSFKWIFREFVNMMGGKEPVTVLTDQARAMEVALASEWKGAVHRWCKWHVLRLAKEKLGPIYSKNSPFKAELHKILNAMMSIEEFELAWHRVLGEYGVVEHPFLQRIYNERHKWAKAFFKDVFCAKQTSTQRSESMNHMMKGYVPPGSPMHHFVTQYLKLVADRDEQEDFQERRSKLGNKKPRFNNEIERHAMTIYSPAMMEVVNEQIFEAGYYRVEDVQPGLNYTVVHCKEQGRSSWMHGRFSVKITEGGNKYQCDCEMTEHMGLLCCHIIKVMLKLDIMEIPSVHILKRWSKDARDILPPHLMGDCNGKRYEELMKIISEGKKRLAAIDGTKDLLTLEEQATAMAKANGSQEDTDKGKEKLNSMVGSVGGYNGGVNDEDECSSSNFFALSQLKAPAKKRGRGMPSSKRDKPGYELGGANKGRKDRGCAKMEPKRAVTCSGCRLTGHTKQQCQKRLQSAATKIREMM